MQFTAEDMKSYHCPRWAEYPDLDLYMDQVISVLERNLAFFSEPEKNITPTMINNYVKQQVLPSPQKKKYNKTHVTSLFMICILKRVISINEIKLLIDRLTSTDGIERAFDTFCEILESSIRSCFSGTPTETAPAASDSAVCILHSVVSAFSSLTYAKFVFDEISENAAPSDKKEEKSKDKKQKKEKAEKPEKPESDDTSKARDND